MGGEHADALAANNHQLRRAPRLAWNIQTHTHVCNFVPVMMDDGGGCRDTWTGLTFYGGVLVCARSCIVSKLCVCMCCVYVLCVCVCVCATTSIIIYRQPTCDKHPI